MTDKITPELVEEILPDALKFDAIDFVEKTLGVKIDDNPMIGMQLMSLNNQIKEQCLQTIGDTYFNISAEEYLQIVQNFGFQIIHTYSFKYEECDNIHYELFHPEYCILLIFDTFAWSADKKKSINGGRMYYNWIPNVMNDSYKYTSSGCFIQRPELPPTLKSQSEIDEYKANEYSTFRDNYVWPIWSGDHDCREALIYHIKNMVNNGRFCKSWYQVPFLWPYDYVEYKKYEAEMKSKEMNYDQEKEFLSKMKEENHFSKYPKDVYERLFSGNGSIE